MGSEKDCRKPHSVSRRARLRRTSLWAAFFLGFAAFLFSSPAALAQAAPTRAILVRGTLQVRGVPYLPANAVPALFGEYRLDAGPVRVWVVREDLFLTPEWGEILFRSSQGTRIRAYSRPVRIGEAPGTAFALRDSAYWILAEAPSALPNPTAFLEALAARLAYFASQAKSPGDLSLPAMLEYRP